MGSTVPSSMGLTVMVAVVLPTGMVTVPLSAV
jgi:hypothetical protein